MDNINILPEYNRLEIPITFGIHESFSTKELCPNDESDDDILYTQGIDNPVTVFDDPIDGTNKNGNTKCEENNTNNYNNVNIVNQNKHWSQALKGITLTILSALFFSVTTVIVKYVTDVQPAQMAFFRFTGILLFTIPVLLEINSNPFGPSNSRLWLIVRGLAGATSLYCRYSALHYMSIANATVIVLSMPVFVFIFARIFLKESFGLFHIFALLITVIGITLTSKAAIIFDDSDNVYSSVVKSAVNSGNSQLIGLAYSIGATLIGASVYVLVRKLKSLHHSVILFNFSWVAITETAMISLLTNNFKLPDNIEAINANSWLMCLVAIFSFYGQLLLTKALQSEEAGLVSIVRASSEVIYAFVFQIVIFKEIPDKWSVLGALLVMLSVLMSSVRKWIISLPKDSKIRQKLCFMTK
ncbi:solute carrier family 35 member G1-like [Oppia nitens]|uniref:solute carrier family 35 member G1-like n=1 Tax=Oppia nitens TaxID=1686743 RepID=UPI0023DACD48|nr:solute carrier family 35 member G1-like [Oppia nitens]